MKCLFPLLSLLRIRCWVQQQVARTLGQAGRARKLLVIRVGLWKVCGLGFALASIAHQLLGVLAKCGHQEWLLLLTCQLHLNASMRMSSTACVLCKSPLFLSVHSSSSVPRRPGLHTSLFTFFSKGSLPPDGQVREPSTGTGVIALGVSALGSPS